MNYRLKHGKNQKIKHTINLIKGCCLIMMCCDAPNNYDEGPQGQVP